MTEIIKLLGTEQSCNTTANTFGGNKAVRLVNVNTAGWLVTHKSGGTTVGSFTLAAGQTITIEKAPTDTLESNTANAYILGTPVAYKN